MMTVLSRGVQRFVVCPFEDNMSLHLHSYPLFALSHSQPKGLGVATRTDMASEEYLGLKPCGAGEFAFVHFCIMLSAFCMIFISARSMHGDKMQFSLFWLLRVLFLKHQQSPTPNNKLFAKRPTASAQPIPSKILPIQIYLRSSGLPISYLLVKTPSSNYMK